MFYAVVVLVFSGSRSLSLVSFLRPQRTSSHTHKKSSSSFFALSLSLQLKHGCRGRASDTVDTHHLMADERGFERSVQGVRKSFLRTSVVVCAQLCVFCTTTPSFNRLSAHSSAVWAFYLNIESRLDLPCFATPFNNISLTLTFYTFICPFFIMLCWSDMLISFRLKYYFSIQFQLLMVLKWKKKKKKRNWRKALNGVRAVNQNINRGWWPQISSFHIYRT